jgi:hypothetical protein
MWSWQRSLLWPRRSRCLIPLIDCSSGVVWSMITNHVFHEDESIIWISKAYVVLSRWSASFIRHSTIDSLQLFLSMRSIAGLSIRRASYRLPFSPVNQRSLQYQAAPISQMKSHSYPRCFVVVHIGNFWIVALSHHSPSRNLSCECQPNIIPSSWSSRHSIHVQQDCTNIGLDTWTWQNVQYGSQICRILMSIFHVLQSGDHWIVPWWYEWLCIFGASFAHLYSAHSLTSSPYPGISYLSLGRMHVFGSSLVAHYSHIGYCTIP